jgi:hypothetical protein
MRHPWNVFEQEAIEALASRMGHTVSDVIKTDRRSRGHFVRAEDFLQVQGAARTSDRGPR